MKLSLPGYATAFEKVNVKRGVISSVNAILNFGREIAITSSPLGADLYVDDKFVGSTPFKGSFTFGEHMLKIIKDDKRLEKKGLVYNKKGVKMYFLCHSVIRF